MTDLLTILTAEERDCLRPKAHPEWVVPMLATLTERRFSDPAWVFERKFDGERCLAFRRGTQIRLLSRNARRLNSAYPEIVDALGRQPVDDFVVDGEVVALVGRRTSFARLQPRMQVRDPASARRTGVAVFYYVFDLLHLDGHDLRAVPLRARKGLLRRALSFADPIRFTAHRNTAGEAFLDQACRWGWEGLIAKRAEVRYQGKRTTDWLKFKCVNQQEVVVGGFTDPAGSRVGLGALLVGYYDNGVLVYAGKVGTGYDTATLRGLRARLDELEEDRPAFARNLVREPAAHWVRPELVAEVGFTEWTRDGKLRHPRFLGLRRDKAPTEVVRETASGG